MTIIAALKIEGIPTLIGDFLITDDMPNADHSWLPTRPQDSSYPNLPRRIRGIGRKLHLINERFIVGFTGPIKAGAEIFAELERCFRNDTTGPSIRKISEILQKFNIQFRNQRAIVIGWTCSSRPRCFRWEAGLNSSAMHVTNAIEGSGRDHFTSILSNEHGPHRTAFDRSTGVLSQQPGGIGYSPHVETALQKSVLLGLVKVGAMLTEELGGARNLQASYGYGAEIALYTGTRLEFVSKVGYFFWHVRIEQNGSITIMPANIKAVYEARGRYCVFEVSRFINDQNSVLTMEHVYSATSTPLHDDMPELVLTRQDAPTPQCSYYYNGIVITDTRSNRIVGPLHLVQFASKDPWLFRFRKKDDVYQFRWNRETLVNMIHWAARTV
jgi:hypothetical protein